MSTFKRFEDDDIVRANPTEVTIGLWSGDTGSLQAFFTSSAQSQSLSGQYYTNVFNKNPQSDSTAEVQFAVAYGHRTGGGNTTLAVEDQATLSTRATYQQYRNLLLNPEDTQFTFNGAYNSDHIYVINIQRARLKEQFDPGNWLITLSGSNGIRTFIDDSGQTLGADFGRAGAVFNVVSGSLSGVSGSTIAATTSSTKGGFGLVYPQLGIIVLNPDALVQTIGMVTGAHSASANIVFAPNTGSTVFENNQKGLVNAIRLGGDFQARSTETISSTHYFIRLRNKEFNYSNNPTFYDETNGAIENIDFVQNPRTYVTTVGMYNDNNELLAVAKMSRPVAKGFDREVLVKARLDF
jgi:hypothetical protein